MTFIAKPRCSKESATRIATIMNMNTDQAASRGQREMQTGTVKFSSINNFRRLFYLHHYFLFNKNIEVQYFSNI